MQGTYVQICQSNANCRQCGTQSPVNTGGMWTEFICERGVSGDQIKVIKDQSWVAFCEVEVYGSEYYVDKGNKNELKKKLLFFLLMFLFLTLSWPGKIWFHPKNGCLNFEPQYLLNYSSPINDLYSVRKRSIRAFAALAPNFAPKLCTRRVSACFSACFKTCWGRFDPMLIPVG